MNTRLTGTIAELKQERARLDSAISALESLNGNRPTTKASSGTVKRTLSPVAHRRIAAAQKARWAKWRKTKLSRFD
jgi:hypothetical protein